MGRMKATLHEYGSRLPDIPGYNPDKQHHHGDPDPSREAAWKAESLAQRHRAIVRRVLGRTRAGLTAEEISQNCGLDYIQTQKRVSDLKRDGEIFDTGQRRRTSSGREAAVMCLSTSIEGRW